MKPISILVILLFAFGCRQGVESIAVDGATDALKDSDEKIVETILLDEDVIKITLSDPPVEDPGEFRKIKIFRKGAEVFQHENPEGWDFVPKKLQDSLSDDMGSERVQSIIAGGRRYLLLFGYPYSCCPPRLTILVFSNNSIETIFDKEFDLRSLRDLDGDGTLELIGKEQFEQIGRVEDSVEIATYAPFIIYTLNQKCEYQKFLSKKYNEANYVFAGFKYREGIEVALPRKGHYFKPFILSSEGE